MRGLIRPCPMRFAKLAQASETIVGVAARVMTPLKDLCRLCGGFFTLGYPNNSLPNHPDR